MGEWLRPLHLELRVQPDMRWLKRGKKQFANHRLDSIYQGLDLPTESEPANWKVYKITIEYCLHGKSADNEERCGLHFSRTIFIIVVIYLIVEAALISIMAYIGRTSTLVILGDA